MAQQGKEKGFILITVLFLLLLAAVTAMSLNSKSGMQVKMAANQSINAQTYFGQLAVIEETLWQLAKDPFWRPTLPSTSYQGKQYTRTVTNSAISSIKDTVIISVQALNALTSGNKFLVNKSFRYNIDTPFLIRTPRQVCLDSVGNIFFADSVNHSIWKIDAITLDILRVAGNGTTGTPLGVNGDGGQATVAQISGPQGVSVDAAGNIYIADTGNHRIRKVTASMGIISTVAGNGTAGYLSDGVAATSTRINSPRGVSVDASGNIYIADTSNHRIRLVTAATGIISTVAGNGTAGYLSDGVAATSTRINSPRGVSVDATGNVYIADTGNHRIRKVTALTGIISTVAGNGTAGYLSDGVAATSTRINSPRGVSVDASGNIYIADTSNHRIRLVTAATGIITTLAGTGTAGYAGDEGAATAAQLSRPACIAVKSTGEVIISDTNNSRLRQVIMNTIDIVHTVPLMTAGTGLNSPTGVATYYDATLKKLFLYIADTNNDCILKLDTVTNAISTVAGDGTTGTPLGVNGDGGQATAAQISSPQGVSVDVAGNIYIADTGNHRIRKVTAATGIISTVAGDGTTGTPPGVNGDGGQATAAQISSPRGVSVDITGNIHIADTGNHRIRKVTAATGIISTVAGNGASGYMSDGVVATSTRINSPQGVAVDSAMNIYIADTGNHRIRIVTAATGIISTVAGNGTAGYLSDGVAAISTRINGPQGVSVDASGNIYIADTGNHRLRIVNNLLAAINPGFITTMANITGTGGYNGDNQPALEATLNLPAAVALGLQKGGGQIFISDSGNDRIRVMFLKTVKEVYGP